MNIKEYAEALVEVMDMIKKYDVDGIFTDSAEVKVKKKAEKKVKN